MLQPIQFMFFNAYNVYYSQASTTKVHVFRSVLEVKVKGQLTSMSASPVAEQGLMWKGGAGNLNVPARHEKVAQWGGEKAPTHFSPVNYRLWARHPLHHWVGVPFRLPDRPPGWQALKKKKKSPKKLKSSERRGGRGRFGTSPWIRLITMSFSLVPF